MHYLYDRNDPLIGRGLSPAFLGLTAVGMVLLVLGLMWGSQRKQVAPEAILMLSIDLMLIVELSNATPLFSLGCLTKLRPEKHLIG